MIYIVLSDNFETDDCWHGSGSVLEYVSLSREKAKDFLEKERYHYMNLLGNEIDADEPNRFTVFVGNWSYNYELFEVPEDTELTAYWLKKENIF
mgnify:CR=1 FL=1